MEYYNLQRPTCDNFEIKKMLFAIFDADYDMEKYIKPSIFQSEMLLTTEERIEKMYKTVNRAKQASELQLNTFTVTPHLIIFQNFIPGATYSATLSFINNCEISKPLRNMSESSGYFRVSLVASTFSTKVAPGMSQQYIISFCGEENKDYFHQLTFLTEAESITVSVAALCSRAILTLPDEILLPETAVKMQSFRSITVKNIQKCSAVLSLKTKPPFYIFPENLSVEPEQSFCLKLMFKPTKLKRTRKSLYVMYSTGEILEIKLEGEVYKLDIKLEKSHLYFEDTFMGLKTMKTFRISNGGNYAVKVVWKKNESAVDEEENRKIYDAFNKMKDFESLRSQKLEEFEILDGNKHSLIYERIFKDEIDEYNMEEHFLFSHPNFQIIPTAAEIYPKSFFEFTVIFSPDKKYFFESTAYGDVMGLEDRLQLSFEGHGKGPDIVLCAESINVNRIYMRTIHSYDITFTNIGLIKGTVSWLPSPIDFGGQINCSEQIELEHDEIKIITLEFSSDIEGKFVEDIKFVIKESGDILTLAFMGEIICPVLAFSVPSINFGTVAFGYPVKLQFCLINTAKIPVEYEIFVQNDGTEPALDINDLNNILMPIPPSFPKNFAIEPTEGAVQPKSSELITITLTANKKGNYSTKLILRNWKMRDHTDFIPIEYLSEIPELLISPPVVKITFCFINILYKKIVTIENKSNIHGYFYLFPLENNNSDVECSCSITRGIILPNSEIQLEFTISTTTIGENKLPVRGVLFGDEPTDFCEIICLGQGPVLELEPETLNFGKVTLLEEVHQNLLVINDTPVPSKIEVVLPKKTVFSVDPVRTEISASSTIALKISTTLIIPKNYKETLTVNVENGEPITALITATGVGTMILFEPKLWPEYDVGTHFTHTNVNLQVTFTNKGNKQHKLFWSRNKFLKQLSENPNVIIPSMFSFQPASFDLRPQEKITLNLEGYSKIPGIIAEDFYLHAVIQQEKHKKIVASFILNGRFVDPLLEISRREVEFSLSIGIDKKHSFLLETIKLKNKSSLPTSMHISVLKPFYLIFNDSVTNNIEIKLHDEENYDLKVGFKPVLTGRRCYVKTGEVKIKFFDHPLSEVIKLTGSVTYPNIKLGSSKITFNSLSMYGNLYEEVFIKNVSSLPVNYWVEWNVIPHVKRTDNIEEVCLHPDSEKDFTRNSSVISDDSVVHPELETPPPTETTTEEILVQEIDFTETEKLPIEKLKYFSAKLIFPQYNYTILKETIYVPICLDDCVEISTENQEFIDKIQGLLFPLVSDFYRENTNERALKLLPEDEKEYKDEDEFINETITIAPSRGFLAPFETSVVTVAFLPKKNVDFFATLMFKVEGGASEELSISGTCNEIEYCFSTTTIEFGRTLFFHLCKTIIWLKNTGNNNILYKIDSDPQPTLGHQAFHIGWNSVYPSSGEIKPNNFQEFEISYYPGIPGEFTKDILFNLNLEPAEKIHLHGFAVFPQIYLNLPRPLLHQKCPAITYLAVTSLTPDYLKIVSPLNNGYNFIHGIKVQETLQKTEKKILVEEGWSVSSLLDFLPSKLDIDLSVERMILYDFLQYNLHILSKHIRSGSFRNCSAPPYEIDFGYVVRETIVDKSVVIFNHGPNYVDVKLFITKKKDLEEAGFSIQFKNTTIAEGKTTELFVIFNPSTKFYPVSGFDILRNFYLEVSYGLRVHILLKAVVVLPCLTVLHNKLNFGNVACGNCEMKSIILKNSGQVPAIWIARIKNQKVKGEFWIETYWKVQNFYMKNEEGCLNPGESCLLFIFFEPQWSGKIQAKLTISMEQTPQQIEIVLKGQGVEPSLEIVEQQIIFEPCSPYTPKYEKLFSIKNNSIFPVEIFFSDFDRVCDEDEAVANVIIEYYNTDRVLIPSLTAGQKLPSVFYDVYFKLMAYLRESLILKSMKQKSTSTYSSDAESLKRIYEEGVNSKKSLSNRQSPSLNRSVISEKKSPSEKRMSEKKSLSEKKSPSDKRSTSDKKSVMTYDPLIDKSFSELQEMIKSTLKQKIKENNLNTIIENDPLDVAFKEAFPPVIKNPFDTKEGVLFIFHGAPDTAFEEIANSFGLKADITVFTIDTLILEAILYSDCLAAVTVFETINKAFLDVASEIDLQDRKSEDEYDKLERQIELLLSGKQKKKPKPAPGDKKKGDKSSKSASTKASSKGSSKDSKKKDKKDTFLGISLEFLQSLLKISILSCKTPLIIESLHSNFIRKPILALTSILLAIENYRYIHFVILSQTYSQRKAVMEEEEKLEMERREKLKQEKILKLMDLTPEELEELSSENLEIYFKEILPLRKLKTLQRKEKLKNKLLIKQQSKNKKTLKIPPSQKKSKAEKSETKATSSKTSKKSKTSSDKSSKGSKGSKTKGKEEISPEEKEIKDAYVAFENIRADIIHISEYWDRRNLVLTKPFPEKKKGTPKQPKAKKTTSKSNKATDGKTPSATATETVREINLNELTEDEIKKHREIGIPLWLFNNVHAKNSPKENISHFLIHTPQLNEAIENLNEFVNPQLKESSETFTVLHKRSENRIRKTSNIFILANEEEKEEINLSLTSSGRRSVSSKISSDSSRKKRKVRKKQSLSLTSLSSVRSKCISRSNISQIEIVTSLTPRNVLQPEQLIKFRVTFYPTAIGDYESSFQLEITSWPVKYTLECFGKSGIPQIVMNPEDMFSKVLKCRNRKNQYIPCAFIESLDVFDFGYIMNPLINDPKQPRTFEKEAKISFCNKCPITCNILFSQKFDSKVYQLDPKCLTVETEHSEFLAIKALPTKKQPNDEELMISIKNNPKIESIRLTCSEADLQFDIYPKELDFAHTVVDTTDVLAISLVNRSDVLVQWLISDFGRAENYFSFEASSGVIPANSVRYIEVKYSPTEVTTVPEQTIEIQIFDENFKCEDPLFIESVNITAESIEVTLLYDFQIDFGKVKYKEPIFESFDILNRGKYNVDFSLQEIVEPEESLVQQLNNKQRKMFTIQTKQGVLQPNKNFTAKFKFMPFRTPQFTDLPIFLAVFSDPVSKKVIEQAEVVVSGKAIPSSFEFCPDTEVDFGHQLIGTEKTQTITLKNVGMFEFDYKVLSLRKYLDELAQQKALLQEKGKKGKATAKPEKATKSTGSSEKSKADLKKSKINLTEESSSKQKVTRMDSGPFSVVSATGTVKPKETTIITLSSKPKDLGDQKQYFLFFITQSLPKYNRGRPYVVKCKSCTPIIDLDNVPKILSEVSIAESKTDFKSGLSILDRNIYFKKENEINFKSVCMNKSSTVRLLIENKGTVSGFVTPTLLTTDVTAFSVKPDVLLIKSYSSEYINVTFTPTAVKEFNCGLQILNNIPSPSDTDVLEFQLCGEGIVPEIKIIDPTFNSEYNRHVLYFDPTLINDVVEKQICFKNVGLIPCSVILDITDDKAELFSLVPHKQTIKYLNFWDDSLKQPSKQTNLVNLKPQDVAIFKVVFEAKIGGHLTSLLKLHLVDNPFEEYVIIICTDTFTEGVVIDGLTTYKSEWVKISSGSVLNRSQKTLQPVRCYEIDFSNTPINILRIDKFKIMNLSDTDTYRFEFVAINSIQFIPTIGHLKPLAVKDVIVTFVSKEAVSNEKEKLACQVQKIQYKEPQYEALSWDDRQSFVLWQPDAEIKSRSSSVSREKVKSSRSSLSKKLRRNFERTEPPIENVPDSLQSIFIYANIVANYADYSCNNEADVITLNNTNLYEKCIYKIEITNTSSIDINIQFHFVETTDIEVTNRRPCSAVFTSCFKKSTAVRPRTCYGNSSSANILQNLDRPFYLTGKENFMFGESSDTESSSLFSKSSRSICDSNCSCENEIPFTIHPYNTSIKRGNKQEFTITFAPVKVGDYEIDLVGKIPHLNPSKKQLKKRINVKSILPLCHFDIEPSNYLNRRVQGVKLCSDVPQEQLRIVEIEAIGLDEPILKSFGIVNPTGESFKFRWLPFGVNQPELPVFHIHNPEGCVPEGKTTNVRVTFLPKEVKTFEALYQFHIDKYKLETTFLFAGIAREAKVNFEILHLQLNPAVVGNKTYGDVILKNNETFSVAFRFKKDSFCAEAGRECVEVEPLDGIINPHSGKSIRISYCPSKIGETRFKIKCKVEKIKKPLQLMVISTCFEVEPEINYIIKGKSQEVLEPLKVNILEFKNMVPHNPEEVTFKIINRGKIGFFFKWVIKDALIDKLDFNIKPKDGFIQVDSSEDIIMTLLPLAKLSFNKIAVDLKILFGPFYMIHISGCVPVFSYKFSFHEYTFGYCLIQDSETAYYHTILEFSNTGDTNIILENKTEKNDFLSVNLKSEKVLPKKSKKILICFHPKEERTYSTKVVFSVNSKLNYIGITGEGVPLKLELVNIKDRFLHLGCPLVGKVVKKSVRIINRSKTEAPAIFDIWDRLPFYTKPPRQIPAEFEKARDDKKKSMFGRIPDKSSRKPAGPSKSASSAKLKKSKSSAESKASKIAIKGLKSGTELKGNKSVGKVSKSSAKLSKSTAKVTKSGMKLSKSKSRMSKAFLRKKGKQTGTTEDRLLILKGLVKKYTTITPKRFTKLKPNQEMDFIITFSPKEKFKSVTENIAYQVQDHVETILTFKVCALDKDFALDKTFISFGSVILKYNKVEKLILSNLGDTVGKFTWKFDRSTQKTFSITPPSGIITPGSDEIFTVKFEPNHIDCIFKRKLICQIEDFNKTLDVTLTGNCIKIPAPRQTLQFKTTVRNIDTKSVKIENTSNEEWVIKPQINGQFYKATELITIGPNSVRECEIIYRPLEMTKNKTHDGYMFFLLPDSQGVVYNLTGTAGPPVPMDKIERKIFTKTYHTELLSVENWLGEPQQFKVTTTDWLETTDSKISKGSTTSKKMSKVSTSQPPLYKTTGSSIIDVNPNTTVIYPWTIYVLRPGNLSLKIQFENEKTKQYLYYIISLTIEQCTEISQIELKTCVRVPVKHTIKLENYIRTPVYFTVTDDSSSLSYTKSFVVSPYSEHFLEITYNPLIPGTNEYHLVIETNELGSFPYTLILTAFLPLPEPSIQFNAVLGQVVTNKALINNSTKITAYYETKFEDPEIFSTFADEISVLPERMEEFEIEFDPIFPGEFHSKVTLTSPYAGVYIFPLIGNTSPPKPTGPYLVRPGYPTVINFRNPFLKTRTFQFRCESPIFSVKKDFESIAGKNDYNIIVVAGQSRKSLAGLSDDRRKSIASSTDDKRKSTAGGSADDKRKSTAGGSADDKRKSTAGGSADDKRKSTAGLTDDKRKSLVGLPDDKRKSLVGLSDDKRKSTIGLPDDKKYPLTGKLVVFCEDSDVQDIKWSFYLQVDY